MGAAIAFVRDEVGGVAEDSTRVLVFLSRSLNVLTGGSARELFCSRAHRKGWAICRCIDAVFRLIRADDREHCRACFLRDKRSGHLGNHSARASRKAYRVQRNPRNRNCSTTHVERELDRLHSQLTAKGWAARSLEMAACRIPETARMEIFRMPKTRTITAAPIARSSRVVRHGGSADGVHLTGGWERRVGASRSAGGRAIPGNQANAPPTHREGSRPQMLSDLDPEHPLMGPHPTD